MGKLKSIIVLAIALTMLGLTGCSNGDIPEDLRAEISATFANRATANIELVEELNDCGIISDEVKDLVVDSINTNLANLGDKMTSTGSESVSNVLKACVEWRIQPQSSSNPVGDKDYASQYFTNLVIYARDNGGEDLTNNIPALGGNNGDIKPISIMSENDIDTINKSLSIPIYVLRKDLNDGLDGIIEAIKKAKDSGDLSGLSVYFEEAKYTDESGKTKTLTFLDQTGESIIGVTSGSSEATEPYKMTTNNFDPYYTGGLTQYENRPGKDLRISQGGKDVLTLRLIEFNSDAIEVLKKQIGLNKDKYLVLDGKAYLMEYPVGYISGFKESEDRESFEAVIDESLLNINLINQSLSKHSESSMQSVEIDSTNSYLSYSGAKSNSDESMASFTIFGSTGEATDGGWGITLGDKAVNMGRVVLVDYLELTYAPGVGSNSENIAALGRKVRILELVGNKGDAVGGFYDLEGKPLGKADSEGNITPYKLYINSFIDIGSLTDGAVKYISASKEKLGDTGNSGGSTDEDASYESLSNMKHSIVSEVTCTTSFPGNIVNKYDINFTDKKPLLYGIIIQDSMFDTGLFSGWIQSTDESKNSTLWWNKWLSERGFSYSINIDMLVNYLKDNFSFELSEEGIIVLDLETISKIQQEFDNDAKSDMSKAIRSIFIIFGYILICYAILLMIAWNVDVNVDLGFSLLSKASFGRWVAVKELDEVGNVIMSDVAFVKFSDVVSASLIIVTIGILFIVVDIASLVLMLVNLFGGIADFISKMVLGVV